MSNIRIQKAYLPNIKDPAITKLPGGLEKIYQIWEDLRERNADGYLTGGQGGGILANIDNHGSLNAWPNTKGTTCTPFTATVIGVAFDPEKYPRDDAKDPYVPLFNGGNDKLIYKCFHMAHNTNDSAVDAMVLYGLGKEVDPKEMARGDMVEIGWYAPKSNYGGHGVFCWDVHLNAKGEVDCFQFLGGNGGAGLYGVSIYLCTGKKWLKGTSAGGVKGKGTLAKADGKDKIFVDDDEVVKTGQWLVLPHVEEVDLNTFRVRPGTVSYPKDGTYTARTLRVGRFYYDGDKPKPQCMKDGSAPQREPSPPGHIDAEVHTVKGNDIKKDPAAVSKVQPKPAKQDEKKPLNWQHDVEMAMQTFFHAKWIESDPGESDNINDAKTQAAIKEFQKLFKLQVDGIVGQHTRDALKEQLPACYQHLSAQMMLGKLFRGGKIKSDPGLPDGTNSSQTRATVKEFQKANGLTETGVPDAATLKKLNQAMDEHAPSADKHGLEPALLVLYWLGNEVEPGGSATLRLVSQELKTGHELQIFLKDALGKEVEAGVKIAAGAVQSEALVPVPAGLGEGATLWARVKTSLDDGKTLELSALAPLYVRAKQPQVKAAPGELQKFFTFDGTAGEGPRDRNYTYVAYKVAGKPQAWLMMGRLIMDVDGAPNAYHPDNKDVKTHYWEFDFENYGGALDWRKNGGVPGNWFGVVTDTGEKTGTPIVQGPNDPCPGFYVAATSLADKTKKRGDPTRYVDARKVPYLAWPGQIYAERGARFTRVAQGPTGTLGDIITAYYPKTNKVAHLVYADNGGGDDPHFGEGSPALAKLLDAWKGITEPEILYIVYPHSGAGQGTVPTADEIREKGDKLFAEWGGLDQVNRVLPLMK